MNHAHKTRRPLPDTGVFIGTYPHRAVGTPSPLLTVGNRASKVLE